MDSHIISTLMQVTATQEQIITEQAGIIDKLFLLVCQYANISDIDGIEPLLTSIQDAARMTEKCHSD